MQSFFFSFQFILAQSVCISLVYVRSSKDIFVFREPSETNKSDFYSGHFLKYRDKCELLTQALNV